MAASGQRRIKLLKLDCEGAEHEIIRTSKLLHLIDEIVGEYHPPGNFDDCLEIFKAAGFQVEDVPTQDGRGLFFAHSGLRLTSAEDEG